MSSPRECPDAEDEFDALLRAVARPETVPHDLADRVAQEPHRQAEPALLAAAAKSARAEIDDPQPGQTLDGGYRLLRELGRGGMGVVFAAENLRTGKKVAVKWMSNRRQLGDRATAVPRFRREARAAARIRHPNVVDVYDVGGSDAAPFLVMELLEGEALSARLRRGALSWEEAVSMMLPVLAGVAAAHRAGIVHRDLKPDNVFLCRGERAECVPKVLDFGIAAIRWNPDDAQVSLTRTGAVLGTPAYMPLEQLQGEEVDARADVYALGVMLYEMLTLGLPFAARGASELAVKQATAAPTPLSKLRPALRGAREAAVMKALARHPRDRHADAEAFAQALTRAGERRRRGAAAWLILLLVVAGAAAAQAWRLREVQRPPSSAVAGAGRAPAAPLASPTPARPPETPVQFRAPQPPAVEPAFGPPRPAPALSAPSRAPKRRVRSAWHAAPEPPSAPPKPEKQLTDLSADDF